MSGFLETLKNINGLLDKIDDYHCESGNFHLNEIEKIIILECLELYKNNRTHAAAALNISIGTLRNKLNEYGHSETI